MNRMVLALALGIVVSVMGSLSCGPARPTAGTAAAQEKPCATELKKFCKDVKSGGGRIIKCLRAHNAELSDKCRAYVNTAAQFVACIDDAMQLCPGIELGSEMVIECVRQHEGDVSEQCQGELSTLRQ